MMYYDLFVIMERVPLTRSLFGIGIVSQVRRASPSTLSMQPFILSVTFVLTFLHFHYLCFHTSTKSSAMCINCVQLVGLEVGCLEALASQLPEAVCQSYGSGG